MKSAPNLKKRKRKRERERNMTELISINSQLPQSANKIIKTLHAPFYSTVMEEAYDSSNPSSPRIAQQAGLAEK